MKKINSIKVNKTFLLTGICGMILGMSFGVLGTVSNEKFLEFDNENKNIVLQIEAKEEAIAENEKGLITLDGKEKELLKKKDELLEQEKKLIK